VIGKLDDHGGDRDDRACTAPGTDRPTQVLLLDPHWITRTALHTALAGAGDVEIAAVAADCEEALATISAARRAPDVLVLTDANDPAVVLPRLAKVLPPWRTRVLVIGGEGFPASLHQCATAGWLPQSATERQFVATVRLIAAGHWVVPGPPHTGDIVPSGGSAPGSNVHGLTLREREVLRLLGHGYTNAEISVNLRLSPSTVKSHVQNLLNKIGVRNRVRAAIYAYEIGLLRPEAAPAPNRARRNPNPAA
jgi:DNA-binding NarL/FixJ family response regulator